MEAVKANVLGLRSKVDRNDFPPTEFANGTDPYPTLSPINRTRPEISTF